MTRRARTAGEVKNRRADLAEAERHRRDALACLVKAGAAVAECDGTWGAELAQLHGFALAMTAGALLHLAQADTDERGLEQAMAIIRGLGGSAGVANRLTKEMDDAPR